jgi:hypothetical protein
VTFRVPKPLPNRHVDYVFEGRAVDDFGRPDPTPVRVAFDPVPCALSARSLTISALIARGIPVTVNCTFTRHVTLDFFLLGKNGGHRVSIPFATDQYSNLGYASIHGLRTGFTVNTRLRLFRSFAPYFRSYRSAVLVVRVQKADGEGIPSYATVTVRQ